MLDQELVGYYQGYTIVVSATLSGPTVFTVGLRGEVIASGAIRETFNNAQEAHQAACAAAHKLIDEHRAELMKTEWSGVRK